MAKPSPEERRRRQALEELPAALARGDVERAVAALLQLPAPERSSGLGGTAPLFRAAVAREFRQGNWSRLVFWAARAEREPRLLAENGTAQEQQETRWALLWGSARCREWARARMHLSAIAARLPPRLTAALEAYLTAEGAPDPEPFVALGAPPSAAPADPRLGYDPGQRATRGVTPTAPARSEEVEPAVLAARAVLGPAEFVATVERWASAAPALEQAILTLATRLAAGEIHARLTAGATAWEPARTVARLCRRLGATADLEAEATLALRVAGAAMRSQGEGLGRDQAQGVAEIVGAAALFPGLRGAATALAAHTLFTLEARPVALDLLAGLCQQPGCSPLVLKALAVWSTDAAPGASPPPWIDRGMAQLLDRPGELTRCLRQVPLRTQQLAVDAAPQFLPVPDAERFLDQAWSWADEPAKQALLDGFDELILRVRARGGGTSGPPPALLREMLLDVAAGMGFEPTERDLREMLDSPMGRQLGRHAVVEATAGGRLPDRARGLWDRFAERIIPYRISYLETALENSHGKPERARAVERYLGEKSGDAHAMLEAIRSAEHDECPLASKALLDRLLGCSKADRAVLAGALLEAGRMRLRRGIRGPLARAFDAADAPVRARGEPDSRDVAAARLEARLLQRRRGGPRAAAPARKPAGRKAGRKARHEQRALPFE